MNIIILGALLIKPKSIENGKRVDGKIKKMNMKKMIFGVIFILMPFFLKAQDVTTNQDIIAMKTSKISDDMVISKIISSKCDFDLTVQGIISLKNMKISDKILKIMFTASPPIETINNDDIISLSNAKISREIINQKIMATPHDFDVSPEGLIKLKTAKVNASIIKTMMVSPKQDKRK